MTEIAAYRIKTTPPTQFIKAYKLFRVKHNHRGEVFSMFVEPNDSIPQNIWLDATIGTLVIDSKTGKQKVKSKLGSLAVRPGFHGSDIPLATHIGAKDQQGHIFARKYNEVWAEVDMANDIDYQPEANSNGTRPDGKFVIVNADIKRIPINGLYRYKPNSNMTGKWIISGAMKINKVLSEDEVNLILSKLNLPIMPWVKKINGIWKEINLSLENFGL